MNGIVITWPQLLYISLVLILFYGAELLLFLRKSAQKPAEDPNLRKNVAEQRELVAELQREIDSLKVRMAAMQVQRQQSDDEMPAMPEIAGNDDSPYSQAIRLAQLGADANKVSAECGISRGEADLIVALYRTGTLH